MTMKNMLTAVATSATLSLCLLGAPAAQASDGFAALEGIDAQALSTQEMEAIRGELNAYDIAAALSAKATTLGRYPRLQDAVSKLAQYYATNADTINAAFLKLGILTPCRSCN